MLQKPAALEHEIDCPEKLAEGHDSGWVYTLLYDNVGTALITTCIMADMWHMGF